MPDRYPVIVPFWHDVPHGQTIPDWLADSGTRLFAAVVAKLPALNWSDLTLDQSCGRENAPMWSKPTEVRCGTNVYRAAAFDGTLPDEIAAFDQAVVHMGWYDDSDAAATIRNFQDRNGKPWGDNHTFDADDLQGLNYSGPTAKCDDPNTHEQWSLGESWVEAGVPLPITLQPPPTTSEAVDLDDLFHHSTGPDIRKVVPTQLAAHHYVAIISMDFFCDYHV
ncbi:MAG TPA: hypothetical protein VGN81_19645 [Pseudonocardiaceae bacterium]|jgi:hypothetical protein